MSDITRAQITAEAAPAWVFLLIRALFLLASGALVSLGLLHNADAASLVAEGAPAVAAIAWSAIEKWRDARRLQLAIAAPAGLAAPPPQPLTATPPKDAVPMPSKFDFAKFAAAAEAKITALAPEVIAALPPSFVDDIKGELSAVATEAKGFVDGEIETAARAVPPALQPFAPAIAALINEGIDKVQAEANEKIIQLSAAKASLAAPAGT